MDLGAHGVGGEVLFPQTRRQFGDAAGRMLADPLQNIDEVGVRIDAVQPAGDDQTLDDADVRGAELSPSRIAMIYDPSELRAGRAPSDWYRLARRGR